MISKQKYDTIVFFCLKGYGFGLDGGGIGGKSKSGAYGYGGTTNAASGGGGGGVGLGSGGSNNEPLWGNLPLKTKISALTHVKHLKFKAWLSEESVMVYNLESISNTVQTIDDSDYQIGLVAGEKVHRLNFIVYKVRQRIRGLAADNRLKNYAAHTITC